MAGGDPGGDFYLATKHKWVHYMKVKLNLPNHVIAAQMGVERVGGREPDRHLSWE